MMFLINSIGSPCAGWNASKCPVIHGIRNGSRPAACCHPLHRNSSPVSPSFSVLYSNLDRNITRLWGLPGSSTLSTFFRSHPRSSKSGHESRVARFVPTSVNVSRSVILSSRFAPKVVLSARVYSLSCLNFHRIETRVRADTRH